MIHTFAAIYIGSYEVSIKIFEISGKKKIIIKFNAPKFALS